MKRRAWFKYWFVKKHTKTAGVLFFGAAIVVLGGVMSAATHLSLANAMFQPGETLDPDCAPTDPACRVAVPRVSLTFVVTDLAARDALMDVQVGDHVIVTGLEKSFIRTQGDAWQELPHTYPSHTHIVTDAAGLDLLRETHELHTGDHAEVVEENKTYVYTQDGVWQELLSPIQKTYVVADIAELNALADVRVGDHAEITSLSKSYIRTQENVWQELLTPPSSVTVEHVYVVTDLAARDALLDISSGDIAIVTSLNTSYVYTQDRVWQEILSPLEHVYSVNSKTGNVILNTDDILEGSMNGYFSNNRARSAIAASAPLSYNVDTGVFGLSFATPLVVNGSELGLDSSGLVLNAMSGTLAINKGGTGRNTVGSAHQFLATDAAGDALEYKTLSGGSNVLVTQGTGVATVAVTTTPSFSTVQTGTLSIGGGEPINRHRSVTVTNVVSASISNRTCSAYATIAVPGAALGDTVVASPVPITGGIDTVLLSWNAYVSVPNSVTIRACNVASAGSINTPNTQTWQIDVWGH